jgi:hypothetical protein
VVAQAIKPYDLGPGRHHRGVVATRLRQAGHRRRPAPIAADLPPRRRRARTWERLLDLPALGRYPQGRAGQVAVAQLGHAELPHERSGVDTQLVQAARVVVGQQPLDGGGRQAARPARAGRPAPRSCAAPTAGGRRDRRGSARPREEDALGVGRATKAVRAGQAPLAGPAGRPPQVVGGRGGPGAGPSPTARSRPAWHGSARRRGRWRRRPSPGPCARRRTAWARWSRTGPSRSCSPRTGARGRWRPTPAGPPRVAGRGSRHRARRPGRRGALGEVEARERSDGHGVFRPAGLTGGVLRRHQPDAQRPGPSGACLRRKATWPMHPPAAGRPAPSVPQLIHLQRRCARFAPMGVTIRASGRWLVQLAGAQGVAAALPSPALCVRPVPRARECAPRPSTRRRGARALRRHAGNAPPDPRRRS